MINDIIFTKTNRLNNINYMAIKNLPAAKNRAAELEKQAHQLQAKIYDFVDQLEMAGLFKQAEHATKAGFELDTTQIELQSIFK